MFNEETSSFVSRFWRPATFINYLAGDFGLGLCGKFLVCPQTFNQIKSQAKPEM